MTVEKANRFEPTLVVPPLTPFRKDLSVDNKALQKQVDYVVEVCNAGMVVAAGVEAQEYHYLSFEQRKDLIRQTIEAVDGRRPVVVGISHPSYRVAVELAGFAADLGAHAVQLLAPLRPYGGAPTQDELLRYFELIASEIDLPLMLYLNPGPGADVSVEATVALASLKQVRYVKESSRNLTRVARLIEEIDRAGHARYFTTVQMLLISLQLGGSGVTMPAPVAALAGRVINAFQHGDWEEAARIQRQFSLFPAKWMRHGLMPVMKAAMKVVGVPAGDPYPPFPPIAGAELAELRAYLKTTDLFVKE
ncbi:dihydrodipicolinate synthase family protein [Alcaligenaceae bacterium]|nr:dihydrodipicolinate synthase family protein [Alcaligenaceae bacterium]